MAEARNFKIHILKYSIVMTSISVSRADNLSGEEVVEMVL